MYVITLPAHSTTRVIMAVVIADELVCEEEVVGGNALDTPRNGLVIPT